jgi:hypothetical protein
MYGRGLVRGSFIVATFCLFLLAIFSAIFLTFADLRPGHLNDLDVVVHNWRFVALLGAALICLVAALVARKGLRKNDD